MEKRFLIGLVPIAAVCLTAGSHLLATDPCHDEKCAVEFLGMADCGWFPEAQKVLIDTMRTHPAEPVRFAAVKAIQAQLEQQKGPLNPTLGWRPIPDPQFFIKLAKLMPGCTAEELATRYAECRYNKKDLTRKDSQCGCETPEVIEALSKTAFGVDDSGCYLEPSSRVRERARLVLKLLCDPEAVSSSTSPDSTMPPPTVSQAPSRAFMGGGEGGGGVGGSANVPIAGRIDMANRLNLFDNMLVQPQTRAFYGLQYAKGVNSGINLTGPADRLRQIYESGRTGQALFQQATGYATYDDFVSANNGVDTRFLTFPAAVVHRFGFEWAVTNDFSFSMQAQYYSPVEDAGQPASWTNPALYFKQVLYRGEDRMLTGLIGISPQIPQPRFGISEDCTRFAPGLLYYKAFGEEQNWFVIGAAQGSFPSQSNAIITADWAINGGWWLYRHESIRRWATAEEAKLPQPLVIGVVPQINFLGKHVLNNNQIVGQFGTSTQVPQRAGFNQDGTRDVIFPDSGLREFGSTNSTFIFDEPGDVVDLTVGTTVMFRGGWQWATGISVPISRGNVRPFEALTTINYYF